MIDKIRLDWLDADASRLEDVRGHMNNNSCTLREAIAASLANDIIDFAPSLNGAAIGLNGTELGIARNLTINGPSSGVTIDGGFLSRIFNVHAGTVTLSNLGSFGVDGAIHSDHASEGGDGIAFEGAHVGFG